jgi:hypothetical protein
MGMLGTTCAVRKILGYNDGLLDLETQKRCEAGQSSMTTHAGGNEAAPQPSPFFITLLMVNIATRNFLSL